MTSGYTNTADADGDYLGVTYNDDDTAIVIVVLIFDPPFGIKDYDDSGIPALRWTMDWINDSIDPAMDAEVYDPIPTGTTYLASGASSGFAVPGGAPAFSTNVGVSCTTEIGSITTTTLCYYEGPTVANPLGQIIWTGTLGPDLGATDAATANNEINITFRVNVDDGINSVENNAAIDADLNDDDVIDEDDGEIEVANVQSVWTRPPLPAIPDTGFAPWITTNIPVQPKKQEYLELGDVWVEIPSLGVKTSIVGIPILEDNWDVTWLSQHAGWLEGTAFPSYAGNSVVTAHVYLPSGLPGPFVDLGQLSWNDTIIIHSYGQQYVYHVRSNQIVLPDDSATLKHEEYPWLTLITCRGYNENTDSYNYRVRVRAVLIEVKSDLHP